MISPADPKRNDEPNDPTPEPGEYGPMRYY